MTTNDVVGRVQAQRIEGSGFWRSGNQERKGGARVGALEGVKLINLKRVTEKVVACHMTGGATGAKNSGKDRQKRRQMSLKVELCCSKHVEQDSGCERRC
jgi:hypothetical protein